MSSLGAIAYFKFYYVYILFFSYLPLLLKTSVFLLFCYIYSSTYLGKEVIRKSCLIWVFFVNPGSICLSSDLLA